MPKSVGVCVCRTHDLSEDEDQNHRDIEFGLIAVGTHTGVADNANGQTGRQTRETARHAGSQVSVRLSRGVSQVNAN